ncbi:sugar phosphate isomerase/epimerase family protein [Rhizobium sp. BK251]|uniref:sugar phosphate isomerase/epimerase family protein n=1 Tax=Rhizobium sp. BK251 TaxID=2512125 RepID=UPI0010D1E7BE|nr:sugar phosphate isomerase/epimerase family protein [Rhizobium sp. BK251]TCL71414.1 D-psicose/D-tagatose/L-ribulose 3-epimerase [Rhizobium sp. BK251]
MKIAFNLLVLGAEITTAHARQLERLKALGYDAVEIPVFSGKQEHYAALGRLLRDIGLSAGAAAVATAEANPVSADPLVRQRATDHHRWIVDCTAAMGGEVIAGPVHSPVGVFTGVGPTDEERRRCVEAMRALADYAAPAGIRISAEALNRFECYLMSTIAAASAIYREVDHSNYGYMFDTFHANIEEKDPPATYERYHREINHFHVSENDRGIPGSGHVPFAAHFEALRRCGYDGWLTVESFSRALPELAGATRVWRDLFDDLDRLFAESVAFIRREWQAAGERVASKAGLSP